MEVFIVSLVTVGVIGLLVILGLALKKADTVIGPALNNLKEMDKFGVLDHLGGMAVELMEERFLGDGQGEQKFEEAVTWVTDRINALGFTGIDEEMIRGAIQRGYNMYVKHTDKKPLEDIEKMFTDYETEEDKGAPVYKEGEHPE